MTAPFLAPGRDDPFRTGRAKASGGTIYYTVPSGHSGASTTPLTSGTDTYTPIWVQSPVVIDQIAGEVTTLEAAQNLRFGLYRADENLQPIGAPLLDSGDISTATTGVKTYTPGTPLFLPRGRYVQVVNTSAINAQIRVWRGSVTPSFPTTLGSSSASQLTVARAYAAFPTPGTAWTGTTTTTLGGFALPYLFRVTAP